MIGSSKNKIENYPRKYFWTQEKETRVKFDSGLSANRPSNNWAQEYKRKCYLVFLNESEYFATWLVNTHNWLSEKFETNQNDLCKTAGNLSSFLLFQNKLYVQTFITQVHITSTS